MHHILPIILIFYYLSTSCVFSQIFRNPFHRRSSNALLTENCYIKYQYTFPYNTSTVYYSDKLPNLDLRQYENGEIMELLFNKIFKENYKVYDPNFWGSVEDLVQTGPPGLIDTNEILLYMHAGWDTAFSFNENKEISLMPFYTPPDYKEISGLFFFESWYLSPNKGYLEKNVIAYFPIREYWNEYSLNAGEASRQKRLIFMLYDGEENSKFKKLRSRKKPKGLTLIYSGIEHELELYNRPYYDYIYRDDTETDISDEEYNEWGYHTFDFYRDFDVDRFLKAIIRLVLDGKIRAADPDDLKKNLNKEEIIQRIGEIPYDKNDDNGQQTAIQSVTIRYDNLNSVIFNEDWYIDQGSLKIFKKVNSITIVRHDIQYDDYTGEFLRLKKTPVITVIY